MKFLKNLMAKLTTLCLKTKAKWMAFKFKTTSILCNTAGEGYLDTVIKLLIAVVLGALLLAGLYALFNNVVMPRLETEVNNMFNYGTP